MVSAETQSLVSQVMAGGRAAMGGNVVLELKYHILNGRLAQALFIRIPHGMGLGPVGPGMMKNVDGYQESAPPFAFGVTVFFWNLEDQQTQTPLFSDSSGGWVANAHFRKRDETKPQMGNKLLMVAEEVLTLQKLSLLHGLRPLSHTLPSGNQ